MNFPDVSSITDSAKIYIGKGRDFFGIESNRSPEKNPLNMSSESTDPALKNRNYAVIITQMRDADSGGVEGLQPFLQVVGAVPQSFQMAQNIGWATPWGAGLAGSGTVGDLLAVTGNRLVGQVMTMQVWQGSGGDFEFTVSFELRTWADPEKDVMSPLRDLLRMSLPSMDSTGWLKSPGPILDEEGVSTLAGRLTKVVTGVVKGGLTATGQVIDGNVEAAKATGEKVKADFEASGVVSKSFVEDLLKNKISIQIGQWFKLDNVVITSVQHDIKAQTPDGVNGQIQAANVTISFKPMFVLTESDVTSLLRPIANNPAKQSGFDKKVNDLLDQAKNLNPFK